MHPNDPNNPADVPAADDNQAPLPEAPHPSAPPLSGAEVTGYRSLTSFDIALMNQVKEIERETAALWVKLMANKATDTRWLAIAKTQLQLGFMAMTRGIAKPAEWEPTKAPQKAPGGDHRGTNR